MSSKNIEVDDFGCYSEKSVDYPDFAHSLVNNINKNPNSKGILICGTGVGMSIVANRNPKIRAGSQKRHWIKKPFVPYVTKSIFNYN